VIRPKRGLSYPAPRLDKEQLAAALAQTGASGTLDQ